MNNPKISIITCNLNGAATLERTIKSVVTQEYDNLEYIVIDGCSTDNSHKILDSYRGQIDTIVIEKDDGISDAFNKGIKAVTGDVVGIISSDDYLAENALEKVARCFVENDQPAVIYGDAGFIDSEKIYIVKPDDMRHVWKRQPLKHSSMFISAKAYKSFGDYSLDCRYAMDYDLTLRFHAAGARFVYFDEVLSYFSGGGVNQQFLDRTIREVRSIAVKHGLSPIKADFFLFVKKIKFTTKKLLKAFGLGNVIEAYKSIHPRYSKTKSK